MIPGGGARVVAGSPAEESLDLELEHAGAGALLVLGGPSGPEPDLGWFTGSAKLGEAFVVRPLRGAARLGYLTPMEREEAAAAGLALLEPERLDVARRAREHPRAGDFLGALLVEALRQSGVGPATIALAGGWPAGPLAEAVAILQNAGYPVVSGSEAMRRARRTKRADEVAEIERVASAVVETFRSVATTLASAVEREGELWYEGERLTVARLKRQIAIDFARHELTQPRAGIVAPGAEGGVPHNAGSPARILRSGESLVVDLYPRGELFADCTRTFCVGAAPESVVEAHAAVVAALELAHLKARPGTLGAEIQRQVCDLFSSRGWPTPLSNPGTLRGYVHNLGHGVGRELHELPSFKPGVAEEEGRLVAGDIVTLEPGLYEPGAGGFGVRLEDLVIVGAGPPRNLTPLPYAIDPRAWL